MKKLLTLTLAGILVSCGNNRVELFSRDMNKDGIKDLEVHDHTNKEFYAFISQNDSTYVRGEMIDQSGYPFWVTPNGDIYSYSFIPNKGEIEKFMADSTHNIAGDYVLKKLPKYDF